MKFNLSEVKNDKPLTLLCHKDDIEIVNDRPDVMTITAEDTLAMTRMFQARHWTSAKADEDFKRRLRIVYPDMDIVADNYELPTEYPKGVQHVIGLIVCTNKAINTGKHPYWQWPESNLHPSTQSQLANLAMSWVKDSEEFFATSTEESGEEPV